ncbi:unnamed protein product [Lasius platythorax]|uniref:Uncharacterized protein n=1 Tax=Lasius platythorax TaxID=488582 RepID=A0AAV2NF24_9HYME
MRNKKEVVDDGWADPDLEPLKFHHVPGARNQPLHRPRKLEHVPHNPFLPPPSGAMVFHDGSFEALRDEGDVGKKFRTRHGIRKPSSRMDKDRSLDLSNLTKLNLHGFRR